MENLDFQQILKLVAVAALAAAAVWGPKFARNRLGRVPIVTPESIRDALDRGDDMLLLDVRQPKEFTGGLGHIAGAMNVPLNEIGRYVEEAGDALEGYKDVPVVTVCRTDNRAYTAAKILRQYGFRDVNVLDGGMAKWNRKGYPATRSD